MVRAGVQVRAVVRVVRPLERIRAHPHCVVTIVCDNCIKSVYAATIVCDNLDNCIKCG